MERKQMEVDLLIKGLEGFIDDNDNVADDNKEEFTESDSKNVQSSNHSKPFVSFSATKSENDKHEFSKLLEMNKNNVLRGIIFSEIFGSPRARRKR